MYIALFIIASLLYSEVFSSVDSERFILLADEELKKGNYDSALMHYSDAINADSSDYQCFWKRSVLYLERQKYREALSDLNQVLNLNPNNFKARKIRARLFLDIGNFEKLEDDIRKLLRTQSDFEDTKEIKSMADKASKPYDDALATFKEKNYDKTKQILNDVLKICPYFEKALLLRAKCCLKLKHFSEGIEDTTKILKLTTGNLGALNIRAKLFLYLGDLEHSRSHYKICIDFDPFFEDCKEDLLKMENFLQSYETAKRLVDVAPLKSIESLEICKSIDSEWEFMMFEVNKLFCKSYINLKDGNKALLSCDAALKFDDRNSEVFIMKGEAYYLLEDFESAVREMKNAVDVDQESHYARQKLHESEKMLKMSKRKNYYKILEIDKSASTSDIKKSI